MGKAFFLSQPSASVFLNVAYRFNRYKIIIVFFQIYLFFKLLFKDLQVTIDFASEIL